MSKTIVLFSGGKDSFYSLIKTQENGSIEYIVSIKSHLGETQLHAGPEVSEEMRKSQLDLIGLPYKEIIISSDKTYLHELFTELNKLTQQDKITHLVTGDLWHPYTSGIGDMLAGALGVKLIRPARDACPTRDSDIKYMTEILSMDIESIVVSVRQGHLPENFVGRKIDKQFIDELVSMNIDAAAEGGEYQSFVISAPIMKGSIVIDESEVKLVEGKNRKENFHKLFVKKFHIEK